MDVQRELRQLHTGLKPSERGRDPPQSKPAGAGRERVKTVKKDELLQSITSILEERKRQIGGLSRDQIGWLSNQVLEIIKERLENATTS